MRYKDFPKHDFRRYLLVLQAIEQLGERATIHYVAEELGCTRAEVSRAVEVVQRQFFVTLEKTGSVYKISDWGCINPVQASTKLQVSLQLEHNWHSLWGSSVVWTREREAQLVEAVASAVAMHRRPVSDQEADVYRLTAQLLKTNYSNEAMFLEQAAHQFFKKSKTSPRPFPKVVADGLVSDLPRLRNLLEKRMSGVHSW